MASKKYPARTIQSWNTICKKDTSEYYILTQEAKDHIEDVVVNGPIDYSETIKLEKSTKRNGEGTGKFEQVPLWQLIGHFHTFS